ncbi:hypothetical protein [Paenibacillus sp. FSL H3-0286]|uniref:hypothetical protein n=1 Tax=Paenibacillus sp. FSL H3-0286 TaxID=2921427 RepID=UPI003254B100
MAVKKQVELEKGKLKCLMCERLHTDSVNKYYKHKNKFVKSERYPLCKDCINTYIGEKDSPEYMERSIEILNVLNLPFDYETWETSGCELNVGQTSYMQKILSLSQYKSMTFKDSRFEELREDSVNPVNTLVEKWGGGYDAIEYESFERKYNNLKNNYQEKTAMHTEALLTYIRYRVKEELATAQGDSKAAKEWGNLAKDAATAAKINPSQFTKADLTNGMDSFGELVRSVESTVDVIDILPRFKQRPNDKVDFTIWCYINYVRDLQGMPPVEYEEIYKFLEQRTKEFEDNFLDFDEGDLIE